MLQFPENYFQKEIRCGFTVSETMKRYWAAQMEVLQEVVGICGRHHLTYYAFWGTLIGMVRHKGFIPWDDDIDIAMKREDYQKFLQIAGKELPAGWHLRNIYEEKEWGQYHAIVTNELVVDISEERLSRFHGCPFVAGVDIFPLDYIPRESQAAEMQKLLLGMIHAVVTSVKYLNENKQNATKEEIQGVKEAVEEGLAELEQVCHVSFVRGEPVVNQLLRLFDKISMMYGTQDADLLTSYADYIKGRNFFLEKEWLGTTQMPFENMVLTAPSDADKVLRAYYGDYMVFEKNTQAHEYPVYKKELAILHERGLWLNVQE
ncbi:MAG: LicD family protein [Lachnospiraceae bacterium]